MERDFSAVKFSPSTKRNSKEHRNNLKAFGQNYRYSALIEVESNNAQFYNNLSSYFEPSF